MENWFSSRIVGWYAQNKRDLPWRKEADPYKIWLSEIILQQTQVKQGLEYYLRFVGKYPNVSLLAKAPEDEVLKLWQGLGYYSRARNLHASAKLIVKEHGGIFPKDYQQIRALKGVGDYTAAAICSFAFNEPYAVVDGNVYRLLSRVFGIKTPIDSGRGKKEFFDLAAGLLNKKQAGTYNQAIMEFGSQYCKPVKPNCQACTLGAKCFANKHKLVEQLPIKAKKTKVSNRYFNYFILVDKAGNVAINKRAEKDIWQGLFEFCLIETGKQLDLPELLKEKNVKKVLKKPFGIKHVSKLYKHILSHQHFFIRFYVIAIPKHAAATTKVKFLNIKNVAMPRAIDKYLNDYDLKKIV